MLKHVTIRGLVLLAVALLIAGLALRSYVAEILMYKIAPSAEKAYAYGSRHLDARDPSVYDIRLAEWFFREALERDTQLPNLQHQLSRISFLRGDLATALARINLELEYQANPSVSSYYMKGLILGYMGSHEEAAENYERFLQENATNWAAINDYAWVLLKGGRSEEAAKATLRGLELHPGNPWLLNTNAIALYELGYTPEAQHQIKAAMASASRVGEQEWLVAYPGNDPRLASEGINALKSSIMSNMHTITVAADSSSYNEEDDDDAI